MTFLCLAAKVYLIAVLGVIAILFFCFAGVVGLSLVYLWYVRKITGPWNGDPAP